jgi:hypothetical protein
VATILDDKEALKALYDKADKFDLLIILFVAFFGRLMFLEEMISTILLQFCDQELSNNSSASSNSWVAAVALIASSQD